jgi:deoxyribonuclease-4
MVFYVGVHVEKIKDATKVKRAGGNILQTFLTKNNNTEYKSVSDLYNLKKFLDKNDMRIVIHSSYTHNLANNWDHHSWWIKNILLEIKYASLMDAYALIIHFGKMKDLPLATAYNNMFSSLVYIHNNTKEYQNVKILLETTSGQGTEMCYKLEDLAYFYNKIKKSNNKELKKRIKICIDTCHIFSAGYDISSINGIELYLHTFDKLIGIKYIKMIHLNDSKVPVGSRKDRHASINNGFIGGDSLRYVFNYFKYRNIPIILETPDSNYIHEIKYLLDKS